MRYWNGVFIATALAVAMGGQSFAGERSPGSAGNGGTPRAALGEIGDLAKGEPIASPKLDAGGVARELELDPAKVEKSYGTIAHSRSGKDTRQEPSEEMKKLLGTGQATDAGKSRMQGEKSRQVFGQDDRVRVTDTTDYPFRTIGLLQGRTADGHFGNCSATLIGPRTLLTAAHCVYSHEHGGWLDDIVFVPGLNGLNDAPYGLYEYETAYIFDGFLTNYTGYYGSVVPWDIAVVILKDPAGDDLGWLPYAYDDALGNFAANTVGYPGDKPEGTMWRANCQVPQEAVQYMYFMYFCDTFPGSSGSSVFQEDAQGGEQTIYGVNVAESPEANVAVRINELYYDWLRNLVE